ncbi:MAG: spore photoproduct lyase family protein [Pseudobdellovibrio sp.]
MNLPVFEKIYIDAESENSEVAERVRKLYPAEIIVSASPQDEILYKKGPMSAEDFNRSKRTLWLTTFRGQFFKRCPGATQKKSLTCCNYYVLNLGSQCNMNCSYCYLQSYLNSHVTKVFTNIDQALAELREMAQTFGDHPFRVGTGEIIDSLSLDEVTLYSRKLITFFNEFPNWIVEFKTKSAKVDQFLDVPTKGNTTVSWSINAPAIIEKEEHGTARLHERIEAAKKCLAKGFKVAFHIDPMIWHPEWKENYSYLAEELNRNFKAEDIHVISLGTLRFQPEQRHMMRERFGLNSYVTSAEMFKSEGDKLRYDASLRGEMFQFMVQKMKSLNPKWPLFLCMETPETWIQSFDKIPMQVPELKTFFKPLPQVRDYQNNQN